ncbi:hypothetical protein TNCV_3804841 [Trichonephila clavipes]|nr:hypothetical protein TNCV_3804841 [Trichonephila clavipes]
MLFRKNCSSITKDPPCRAAMHTKSVESLKHPPIGVVVRRGAAQVSSMSLDHGSKLRGPWRNSVTGKPDHGSRIEYGNSLE